MTSDGTRRWLVRLASDYSMMLVLLALCAFLSYATLAEQHPTGAAAGAQVAGDVAKKYGPETRVLIVVRDRKEDGDFADALEAQLAERGITKVEIVRGQPQDARQALERLASSGKLDVIAANEGTASWPVLQDAGSRFPSLSGVAVLTPRTYRWPNFLKRDNLLNIANQIAVIAILAVGMTMVIITGGIDLSVGSLIALSAVTATLLIRDWAGAELATPAGMVVSCLVAIALCALIGLISGTLVTAWQVPPFIVTLAMMLEARGLASRLSRNQSIYQVPGSFGWLGLGAEVLNVPNTVFLTACLYLVAHVIMTRTTLGRYIYAVGGNAEAARLSGVPVQRILLFVYAVSGALAGLGGVMLASQLRSGSPAYGLMYELTVIAAVVVGGTSLSGGEGRILGTLVGVLVIAVIQNGMNLTGVESDNQNIILGLVLLGAVLIDRLKHRGKRMP